MPAREWLELILASLLSFCSAIHWRSSTPDCRRARTSSLGWYCECIKLHLSWNEDTAHSSVLPTTLLPLHLLSLPSLLSTVSTFLLVLVILLDGLIKTSAPGSILHPSSTSFGPELQHGNWLGGIGLVLAGFGGHAVVPSLARDMRHPHHFDKVINKAFAIAAGVSFVAGAAGYLMIGNTVSDEVRCWFALRRRSTGRGGDNVRSY